MSFESQIDFEKELCTKCPLKIDIGAVMNIFPRNNRFNPETMVPVQKEVVFDIDMSDYDNVRTCCSGAAVCSKCWKFMVVACRILDTGLREDFGWQHLLWVFSGRRGIHCWICDNDARYLNGKTRSAVAEYFQIFTHMVVEDNVAVSRVKFGQKIHHSIRRALRIIESMFEEVMLIDQDIFQGHKGIRKLCQMICDAQAAATTEEYLIKTLNNEVSSQNVWEHFKKYANKMRCSSTATTAWSRRLRNIIEEIQLVTMYPRLDINVTKGFNHLLKAPFSIHPVNGKVSIPFHPNHVAKFDPNTVPTITVLLEEVNAFDEKRDPSGCQDNEKSRIKDYKKTSIFKAVLVFEEFIHKLESHLKMNLHDEIERKLEF